MKNKIFLKYQQKAYIKLSLVLGILSFLFFTACDSDDIGDNYYTFTGETIGVYITKRDTTYSEFSTLLDTTDIKGLLNAYGEYTCFAPNNDAMFAFYKSKNRTSLEEFPLDTLKKIAYDHIIKDFSVSTDLFVDGFLPYLTMSGRYIDIETGSGASGVEYYVNTSAFITLMDEELHNGYLHQLDQVLAPTENSLFEAIAADSKFSLFTEALIATGLNEAITAIEDETYVPDAQLVEEFDEVLLQDGIQRIPKKRKYGFTAFIESDSTYLINGITTLDEMETYAKQVYDQVYPEDAGVSDITNKKNSLNRFVAYHLTNKKIPKKFILEKFDNSGWNYETTGETHSIKTYDMFEYIETMCPNTLMEARTYRSTSEYNILNMLDDGSAIRLTENFDNDAINGVYHEIDNILAYSPSVERMLSSKKLRMDAASFFPEFTNNNIRTGHATPDYAHERWWFPQGYLERVTVTETTTFGYINSDDRFMDYQGDEIFLKRGLYDFEITTLPIPAGTYEVRFAYQPTGGRGAAQLYWDGQPSGIPLDLTLLATNPKIGYVVPGSDATDPNGFENDKMMRNRGYMKGSDTYTVINEAYYDLVRARYSEDVIRKILGIYTFDEDGTHKLRVKAARSGEFMLDYLEFVPLEILENEGIE